MNIFKHIFDKEGTHDAAMDKAIEERILLLAKIPLFRDLKEKHLKCLALSGEEMDYKAGDIIVKEGTSGIGCYIIMRGKVGVSKKDTEIASLVQGDYFGEISLIDGGPRTADVIAKENSRVYWLPQWHFMSFLKEHPDVTIDLLKEVCRRLRAHQKI
jgi:CRP/FNR family transcriptional regulator, cyclic AMP receptor protein